MGLCRETWGEEQLFDALKDLPHGKLGRTRLMYAAQKGDLPRVRWLFKRGAVLDLADHEGRTALHFASGQNRLKMVRTLLRAGAMVDGDLGYDYTESTPLYAASAGGHADVVRQLLRYRAKVNFSMWDRSTPLYAACEGSHLDAVAALLSYGAKANIAMDKGSVYGNSPYDEPGNDFCTYNVTPLSIAVKQGREPIVRALLASGADPNIADNHGASPLFLAAKLGHESIVRALLEYGGNIERRMDGDDTFTFLDGGFDVYDKGELGATPLLIACKGSFGCIAIALLAHGANASAVDDLSNTPLHYASAGGDVVMVRALIASGGLLDGRDLSGTTPLNDAIWRGHSAAALVLLAAGADVDSTVEDGCFPLVVASGNNQLGVVRALLAKGAAVDRILFTRSYDADGDPTEQLSINEGTSLHASSKMGHVDVVSALLSFGANVQVVDGKGDSSLHLAARAGHLAVLRALLFRGADATLRNAAGESPHDCATLEAKQALVGAGH